ncbi:MAG: pilin [Proteobacteria bacterium]|nr:pilin [Pseudomonadota bacterium]
MQNGHDESSSATSPLASGTRAVLAALILAAIVAGLSLLYVRQHHGEAARGQISKAIADADGVRMAVALYRARTGGWPPDNAAAGLQSPSAVTGKYLAGVHIEAGRIVITLGGEVEPALRGERVILSPYLGSDVVRWHCAGPGLRPDLLPENCR